MARLRISTAWHVGARDDLSLGTPRPSSMSDPYSKLQSHHASHPHPTRLEHRRGMIGVEFNQALGCEDLGLLKAADSRRCDPGSGQGLPLLESRWS